MGAIASQITSLMIAYSTVYSDADQRKHQSCASLAFVWRIHRAPRNSPHKWPVTRKMYPFDDVIMLSFHDQGCSVQSIFPIHNRIFRCSDSHYTELMVIRLSYLCKWNRYISMTTNLYWFSPRWRNKFPVSCTKLNALSDLKVPILKCSERLQDLVIPYVGANYSLDIYFMWSVIRNGCVFSGHGEEWKLIIGWHVERVLVMNLNIPLSMMAPGHVNAFNISDPL